MWNGENRKTSNFLDLCVNISKMVRDSPKLLSMTNRKLHVRFRLGSTLTTLNDLELLQVRIFREFRGISQIWKATTTSKRMKIDPYCQQQNYSPLNVHFSDDCVGFAECSSARVCNENYSGRKWRFSTSVRDNISQ